MSNVRISSIAKTDITVKSISPPASPTKRERGDPEFFKQIAAGNMDAFINAYIKFENLLVVDADGNNILHIAAKNDQRQLARGIMALTIYDSLLEKKNDKGLTPSEVASPRIRKDIFLLNMKAPLVANHHSVVNKRLIEEKLANFNENHKVMLSLDGGGIKAILELTVLIAIEKELNEPLMSRVHWVGGTSCGGIISICLGCGVSLDKLRRMFLTMRRRVFCGDASMIPRHDAAGIEEICRLVVGANTSMAEIKYHKVMVTAAKIKYAPPQLVLFRSYAPRLTTREAEKHGYLNPEQIMCWKAMRSTSAAPVFFKSFHGLVDGAVFCNNPCLSLIAEQLRYKKLENHKGFENKDEIGCIITLGSGVEPNLHLGTIDLNVAGKWSMARNIVDIFGKGKNLVTLFLYQCTSSHLVSVAQAREWAHSLNVPYFRFSPRLSKAYELDSHEIGGIFDFMFETEVYIRTEVKQDIKTLCRLLRTMPKNQVPAFRPISSRPKSRRKTSVANLKSRNK